MPHPYIVSTTIVALLVAALGVVAAPILAQRPEYPDELLALADIRQVAIEINTLPGDLRDAGVTEAEIRRIARGRLSEAGYEIVDDADHTPRLQFTALVLTDPSVPDTVGFIVFFDLVQHVRVYRLKQDFTLPTATLSAHGVRSRKLLAEGLHAELQRTLDRFIEWEQLASKHR